MSESGRCVVINGLVLVIRNDGFRILAADGRDSVSGSHKMLVLVKVCVPCYLKSEVSNVDQT